MIETDAPPPPSASVGERPRRTTKALPPKHRAPANSWSARLRTLWIRVVPLLLLLLGAEIRIRQWLGGRSLWLDESLIARSIVNRSYGDLLIEPLFHNQAAPLGWLWAERLCVDLFGRDERSLRIVPLLAGLGTLFLTWRLARRLLPPGLVPVAVGLVALAPNLVYYGNEVKQYSSDVLVVLVIIAMALRIPAPVNVGRPLVRFTLFAVAAVWLSHAAVFALAGTSLVLALRPLADRDVLRSLRVSVVLSPWL
ncbi:MAG TPA: glycosyltransferase family 39 protein, partial [Mycobacteriales bacterium]|nr:glycosyltransferase family 39 protein [Mycobacteriales bacterium]